jgi:ZIP family zinc transporter
MDVWTAVFWGAFSSAALYIGQWLAAPMQKRNHATGMIMGFGAGTMISAIAYELIPATNLENSFGTFIAVLVGAMAYFVGDQIVDRGGGGKRQDIDADRGEGSGEGSGAAMFIGALLDGVPEAFILGITLKAGGGISIAFVTAVFVSNIPQGIAGTNSLKAAGYTDRHVFRMWTGLLIATAVTAAVGFIVADKVAHGGLYAEGFAAGAVLTMLADSMMPEAFEHGGKQVGLITVVGYLVAAALTFAD